jgi:copper chaperone CopZ
MNIKLAGIIAAIAAVVAVFALPANTQAQCCASSKKTATKTDKQDCAKDCGTEVADADAKPEAAAEAKPGETEIKVPTLACGMCVKKITKAVQAVEGVTEVTVDRKNKVAKVSFDPEKTTLEKIEIAIVKAGYVANDKKADEEAFAKLPDCCKAE